MALQRQLEAAVAVAARVGVFAPYEAPEKQADPSEVMDHTWMTLAKL